LGLGRGFALGLGRSLCSLGLACLGLVRLRVLDLRLFCLGLGLGVVLLGSSLLRRRAALALLGTTFAFVEVLFADAGGRRGGSLAFQDGVGSGARVQLDRADRVVVTRDGVVHQGRIIVG